MTTRLFSPATEIVDLTPKCISLPNGRERDNIFIGTPGNMAGKAGKHEMADAGVVNRGERNKQIALPD
ncbi:hypothetical protein [Rhodococcus globerulus]|uniref:hypothetical protein n=1 Tax=Rhodococcus globerulus TaxID=33008 RepID=UPI000524450F|nr:hypothetical protein [Rhodococcus globerulus]NMD60018.1 hypothetical protein [Nocardia globerula]